MKAKDVVKGGRYMAKVSGNVVPVTVLYEDTRVDFKGRTKREWRCINEVTRRAITVRSAQRFRGMAR